MIYKPDEGNPLMETLPLSAKKNTSEKKEIFLMVYLQHSQLSFQHAVIRELSLSPVEIKRSCHSLAFPMQAENAQERSCRLPSPGTKQVSGTGQNALTDGEPTPGEHLSVSQTGGKTRSPAVSSVINAPEESLVPSQPHSDVNEYNSTAVALPTV